MKKSRSRRKKSHRLRYGVILVLIILVASYAAVILTRPLKVIYPASLANPIATSGQLNVEWPNAEQASIGVLGNGTLMSNGAQTPTPTASIAKMVTALAVLKKYPLSLGQQGPTITINSDDVADYNNFVAEDGSVVKVTVGEQITEYQALEAMLLPSANNMADTLAVWAFGSINNYVTYANTLTKSLGMSSTTITDPSGYLPTTVSTSSDLIKLGEANLYNPVIAQIVYLPSAVLPVAGQVLNVDHFVGQYNLIGIKTGNTDQAGGCFLSAAKYNLSGGNSMIVIGAIMKAPTLEDALNDTLPMLGSVENQLQLKNLDANTTLSTYKQPWGGTVSAVTKDSLKAPYLPGMEINYSNKSSNLIPPSTSGSIVGRAEFGVGNDTGSTTLILQDDVTQPSILWKLTHPQYFL